MPGRAEEAFDGVFAATAPRPSPPPGDAATPAAQATPEPREPLAPSAPPPDGGPNTPVAEDDPRTARTVQGNWRVPAGLLAKIRAIREIDGTAQSDLVREALARHVAALEAARGAPYPIVARHLRGGHG